MNNIINFLGEFFLELRNHKYIAFLLLFLYISTIFLVISTAIIYKDTVQTNNITRESCINDI